MFHAIRELLVQLRCQACHFLLERFIIFFYFRRADVPAHIF